MKTAYAASFVKDLKRLRGNPAYERIKPLAFVTVPALDDLSELVNLKKLKNADHAYRIRVGDCRIGFTLEGIP